VKKNIDKGKVPTTAEMIADMAQALRAVEKTLAPMGGMLSPDTMEISAYSMSVKPLIHFDKEKLRGYLSRTAERKTAKSKKRPVSGTQKQAKGPDA
jgi:hypothetical protein